MAAFTQQTVAAVDARRPGRQSRLLRKHCGRSTTRACNQAAARRPLHAGLHKMKQLLGDAAKGSDSAIGSFNQLHLDFRQLLERCRGSPVPGNRRRAQLD